MRPIDAENFEVLSWKATDNQDYNDGFNDGVLFVMEKIDNAPTIDVMPVMRGRWIDIPDKPEWDQKMCSICGDYRCCQGNYCPNCGAKMINEE